MKLFPVARTLIIPILFCFAHLSCVSDSEEELYGIIISDPSTATWEYPIKQILEQNCVICHNENLHYNGVRHDTYLNELKVVEDGRLKGAINHLPTYPRMPYQQSKLPEYELELVNAWIANGAPEKLTK